MYINLAFTATGNSHAIWDHTVLPATWQRWVSHLYHQLKQVLNLATPEGYKTELTYVMWKQTSWDLNQRPANHKSNALPQRQHATCMWGNITDVITCVKFCVNWFYGFGVLTPKRFLFFIGSATLWTSQQTNKQTHIHIITNIPAISSHVTSMSSWPGININMSPNTTHNNIK